MRIKQLWDVVPLPVRLRIFWSHITLSKWTSAFFFLALGHFILQTGLQFGAYANNLYTSSKFDGIISDMTLITRPFAILESNGDLTLCANIPERFGGPDKSCLRRSFDGSTSQDNQDSKRPAPSRRLSATPEFDDNNSIVRVELSGLESNDATSVDFKCVQSFPWIFDVTHDATREDLVFVLYQGWLFGISAVALLEQSIPHLAAALASECLATIWSIYKIVRTEHFKGDFDRVVTQGSCNGVDVLPKYFGYREGIEATIIFFNVVVLVSFFILTWRLFRDFQPLMLKRVESRKDMDRLHRITQSLSTIMHLAAFFLIAVAGVFIDQMFIGRIRTVAEHLLAYEIVFLLLIFAIIPWLILGLRALRKESRRCMLIFFVISIGFLATWGAMFGSQIYRFMFNTWSFFATLSITACLLLVTVLGLSVYAFLNFGLGLPEYLQATKIELTDDNVSWTIEKRAATPENGMGSEATLRASTQGSKRGSLQSTGDRFSLNTQPSIIHLNGYNDFKIGNPILSKPAVDTKSASQLQENELRRPSLKLSFPPGLSLPPPKPAKVFERSKPQQSRWSATTIATEIPPTPAPLTPAAPATPAVPTTPASMSAVGGGGIRRGQSKSSSQGGLYSRWSTSTSTTTSSRMSRTTAGSGGSRASQLSPPPVPHLPTFSFAALDEKAEITNPKERNLI